MEFETLCTTASLKNLNRAVAFVEGKAAQFGLAPKKKFGAILALEEAFVNICRYAYVQGEGEVILICGSEGTLFVLEIIDMGSPFDLLSLPEPDVTSDIMERKIGGLGVHFIRKMSDSVSYRREQNRNILRMAFKRA